jgi:hypothetical protein
MSDKQIKVKDVEITQYDISKPAEVVKMATTLKAYVVKEQLYTNIKGKNYCHVDGWAFAGFIGGLHAQIESVENLSTDKEIKWKAVAHVYKGDKMIGPGIALCSSKESAKKGFDEYAILSMAQTRAIGKAYRNAIGWVMKMAGYSSTPAEEMHKVGEVVPEPSSVSNPPITQNQGVDDVIEDYVCSKCGKDINKAEATYSTKLYGRMLCRDDQKGAKKK